MINNQFIDCLKLIDGITIHTGDAIGADYCHDEYPGGNFAPEAVVEAKSAEEVAAVLKLCSENDVPVNGTRSWHRSGRRLSARKGRSCPVGQRHGQDPWV